ncbi:hypothetical protein ANN_21085 [Periplaneta americana]|uniref:Uncharacterized protein n=1 Tax=Periplaneta americana TaxID=6978 RepID=A0ABQ8SF97_PERAM|nr:hypothetical protein ANN_21085 [Periplaneta americana]
MDLREVGYDDRDWINLAQDRDQRRAYHRKLPKSLKNLNQVTCPDRELNPGHLVSRPDALTVTLQLCFDYLASMEVVVFEMDCSDYLASMEVVVFEMDCVDYLASMEVVVFEMDCFDYLASMEVVVFEMDCFDYLASLEVVFEMDCFDYLASMERKSGFGNQLLLLLQPPTYCAVASWTKAPCLGLALRNARWFESSWGKKLSHEISVSVWDRCPPSINMHLWS